MQYQVDINPQICLKIPRNTKTKKKNSYAILGSVNVLLQYNKNILLLLSAVDQVVLEKRPLNGSSSSSS